MAPHESVPIKRPKLSLRFEPILPTEIYQPVELMEICILSLQDKRNVPRLLKVLPELPASLSHVKRIKDGRMIVYERSEVPDGVLLEEICRIEGTVPRFSVIPIPKIKPKTRSQYDIAKEIWPTAFHEDKKLESLLNGTHFSDFAREKMAELFFHAQEIGGCIVYDPKNDVIVTENSGDPEVPNRHPVICAVDFICEEARQKGSSQKSEQYLGNGYDFYLSSEPCAMCSMAMVHMRVGRVFFGRSNANCGALFSHCRLHLKPEINHHYEVFRIVTASENELK